MTLDRSSQRLRFEYLTRTEPRALERFWNHASFLAQEAVADRPRLLPTPADLQLHPRARVQDQAARHVHADLGGTRTRADHDLHRMRAASDAAQCDGGASTQPPHPLDAVQPPQEAP